MKFVGVTSCPTGIAHTYMAAESLEQAAKAAGHEIAIETQGSGGFKKLDPAVIAAADGVIFANDVEVRDKARFAGKPTLSSGVKRAINDAPAMIAEAVAAVEAGPVPAGTAAAAAAAAPASGGMATKVEEGHFGIRLRGYLMTGVSYMIPFVAGGGILIALAFMLSDPVEVVKVNGDRLRVPRHVQLRSTWMTGQGSCSSSVRSPSDSSTRSWRASSRTRSPTGPASCPVSSAASPRAMWVPASSAPSSVASPVASSRRSVADLNVPKAIRGVMPVVVIPLLPRCSTAR